MRYQKVYTKIWNDEKFRKLSPEAQRLYLYLLTNPHSNLIGLYILKEGYALEDLTLNHKNFEKFLHELINFGVILYDELQKIVFIKNYLKYNPVTNDNQITAAKRMFLDLPRSQVLDKFIKQLEILSKSNNQFSKGLLKELYEVLCEVLYYSATATVIDTATATDLGKEEVIISSSDKEIIDYFVQKVKEKKGIDYVFSSGKDGGAVNRFNKLKIPPDYKELIDYYLKIDKSDKYLSLSACLSADTINQFNLKKKKKMEDIIPPEADVGLKIKKAMEEITESELDREIRETMKEMEHEK